MATVQQSLRPIRRTEACQWSGIGQLKMSLSIRLRETNNSDVIFDRIMYSKRRSRFTRFIFVKICENYDISEIFIDTIK